MILVGAFDDMMSSRNAVFTASERALACQEALKKAEAAIINSHDPKELGGNEAARAAKVREMTSSERADLEEAERIKRAEAVKYELKCMAVDCLKWQIRADLAAKGMVI